MGIGPVDKGRPVSDKDSSNPSARRKKAVSHQEKKDQTRISETARQLQVDIAQQKRIAEKYEAIHREKLKAVARRIDGGFYKRPDIQQKIADKLVESEEITDVLNTPVDGKDDKDDAENGVSPETEIDEGDDSAADSDPMDDKRNIFG